MEAMVSVLPNAAAATGLSPCNLTASFTISLLLITVADACPSSSAFTIFDISYFLFAL